MKSPPCTCGSLIAGIWLQSSNCFNRCCRAVILNKRYFISRGYLHRLQEVRGNATKLSLFGQNKNVSTYLSFRVTNLLGANFSIFIISLSRSTAQHTHVLSTWVSRHTDVFPQNLCFPKYLRTRKIAKMIPNDSDEHAEPVGGDKVYVNQTSNTSEEHSERA